MKNNDLQLENLDDYEKKINEFIGKAEIFIEKDPKVKHWELFGGVQSGSGIKIEKGFLKSSTTGQTSVITLRLYGEKGNVGSACISRLSMPFIESAIDRAIKMMKVSIPNSDFIGLASPPKAYPKVIAPWDSNISQLEVEDSLEIINFFMKQMNRDEKIKSVSGGFGYGDSRISVKNSNGINISEKSTSVSISAEIIMEESINGKKENSNGYDWQSYNDFSSIESEKIFDTAYNMAIKGLKKTKIETMSCPVILSPLAVDLLVSSAISSGICADAVYEKRSFLQNKLDTPISNDILEIVDDPWVENGYATSPFDIEGIPTKPLKIVENGYLKSFLHNVYTANLFKTQSTGHASRSWQSATIGIDTSNIIVKNGNTKLDSMISEIDNGIFIEYSYDSPNIVTGDFSGLITNGYIIKDGEIGNSLKETMLGTNLLDLYQKIEKVSVETIRKDSEYLPYILVSELTVSGAK